MRDAYARMNAPRMSTRPLPAAETPARNGGASSGSDEHGNVPWSVYGGAGAGGGWSRPPIAAVANSPLAGRDTRARVLGSKGRRPSSLLTAVSGLFDTFVLAGTVARLGRILWPGTQTPGSPGGAGVGLGVPPTGPYLSTYHLHGDES